MKGAAVRRWLSGWSVGLWQRATVPDWPDGPGRQGEVERGADGQPGRRGAVGDQGSATAELAVSLPALVLMVFAALTAVVAVRTQLECVDAAREAARATARGESGQLAGQRVAPPGAAVSVQLDGGLARATVRARVHPLGPHLPGFAVDASAVAALEPGVPGPGAR